VKMRYYGFLATKKRKIPIHIRQLLDAFMTLPIKMPQQITKSFPCPNCGKPMAFIGELPRRRGPPWVLLLTTADCRAGRVRPYSKKPQSRLSPTRLYALRQALPRLMDHCHVKEPILARAIVSQLLQMQIPNTQPHHRLRSTTRCILTRTSSMTEILSVM
jgi:hypothetical protein